MADSFLSQEEVDALLEGVTGESQKLEKDDVPTDGVRTYNLSSQERIVRGRMPTMELINERFARYLRIGLFNYMHRNAEVSVGPIKVQKYAEFVRNLVVPTNLNLVIAKDSGRWQVDLVAGANQIRDAYNNDAGSTNNRTWDSYAGVQVQIPIGDISTRQAEVRARVNVEDQAIRITDARQELERSVNNVVRDLGTRWRQYEIAQRAVELSKRKLEIEREKLSAGRSSNFQVLSYESDLRTSENARLNALIAYLNAQTQLDLTLGTTLETWDIALNDY